jgi:pimeloyl-ACP methyl ester carboxylesterase
MNRLRFILVLALVAVLLASLNSCSKDTTPKQYVNFVSKDVAVQLTEEYMGSLVDVAAVSNPEVAQLKPLISTDVTVFRVVYKTIIDGSEINASGLVCAPSKHGTYPVLSFQNGTNTVNDNAPSMQPADYSYQMLELIASTGYVVVIPDYPGFGASSSIHHPYLITQPTVRSLVDMLYTVKEMQGSELPGIKLNNKIFLLGYSQGGWATLALHKALELDYNADFDLAGSACGAGPYNIFKLLQGMVSTAEYPMPVYLGYIIHAYSAYDQFSNPVSDLVNEPYATRIGTLYDGTNTSDQINSQLTTSVTDFLNAGFLEGFETAPEYSSVRYALDNNSIEAWHSTKPLMFLHGTADTSVDPSSTEDMYSGMIAAGTDPGICQKVLIPGAGHSEGIVPALMQGMAFLNAVRDGK